MVQSAIKKQIVSLPKKQVTVKIRPLEEGDRQNLRDWLKDPYLVQLTFIVPGPEYSDRSSFSEASADRYIDNLLLDPKRKTFAIMLDDAHVGTLGLKAIDLTARKCECFIEVGEGNLRGKGVGTAAMALLLDQAFQVLALREMHLDVLEFNKPAISLYEKLGFVHLGRVGWHYDIQNTYRQILGMKISDLEWFYSRSQLKLNPDLKFAADE